MHGCVSTYGRLYRSNFDPLSPATQGQYSTGVDNGDKDLVEEFRSLLQHRNAGRLESDGDRGDRGDRGDSRLVGLGLSSSVSRTTRLRASAVSASRSISSSSCNLRRMLLRPPVVSGSREESSRGRAPS